MSSRVEAHSAQPGYETPFNPRGDGGKKGTRHRGEREVNRKTIAWGMPDVSGASAVNTGAHTSLPQRAPGCGCIGHPAFPAPSVLKGRHISGKARARCVARMRVCVSGSLTVESESEASTHGASYPSPASVSEAWGGWHIESAANDVTGGGWLSETNSFGMRGETPHPGAHFVRADPRASFARLDPTARKSSRGEGWERARKGEERECVSCAVAQPQRRPVEGRDHTPRRLF
jgi:hypothetical protein